MEPQTIPIQNGRLTCRVQGGLARLYLEIRPDRPGLYRGVLRGPEGHWDLGLLLPEGGCLRLGRTLSVQSLTDAGCWPVQGADAVLAHAFSGGTGLPPGWRPAKDPAAMLSGDPVLQAAAAASGGWLVCRGRDGRVSLAAPWDPARPFPLVPAFCLARVREMAGQRGVVYRIGPAGTPVLPDGEK